MPVYPISFSIPPEKIIDYVPTKTRITASIIPGDLSTYIYKTEESYYQGYRDSFFGVTMQKAGWDCMRHYEILANGCIPLFINFENLPENTMTFFPKDIITKTNGIYMEIMNKKVMESKDIEICNKYIEELLEYTRHNLTTTNMAKYILKTIGFESAKRILFLSGNTEPDYLRCLTLSGFKNVLGAECHDYPKVPHLYTESCEGMWGRGITYTNIVNANNRNDEYDNTVVDDIMNHRYDIIIYGSYHRGIPFIDMVSLVYKPNEIVFLCGEDCDRETNHTKHECELKQNVLLGYNVFIREQ